MKIPELQKLINQLTDTDDLSLKEKKSLASKIKKNYNITMQDLRKNGQNISLDNLKKLINSLIEDYDKIKDIETINEIIQIMVEDYSSLSSLFDKQKLNIEKDIENIYKVILGNPGTSIDGMSSDYISKIIRLKLTEENGINRDDIMNVLVMQGKNMYIDIDEYQKLINDSVISYLTNNKNGEKFSNSKIIKILQNLAASYKVQGNYDKVKEIYEQALRIKSLENTSDYIELNKNYEEFIEFIEMEKDFDANKFDSFDDLMNSLQKTFTSEDIFVKGSQEHNSRSNASSHSNSNYIMPIESKLAGFEYLVNFLKNMDESYDLLECDIGKGIYNGYVIFKIQGANISILENFATEINEAMFIVNN